MDEINLLNLEANADTFAVKLAGRLCVENAQDVHLQLANKLMAAQGGIQLDISEVEDIDLSAIQLLISYKSSHDNNVSLLTSTEQDTLFGQIGVKL